MTHIHSQQHDAVGIITIDRPARFNALDVRTAQDFRRVALQFARDDDIRAVVLRGLPGMFCSGADLKFIRDGGDANDLEYLTRAESRRGAFDPRKAGFGHVFKQILEYIHSAISEIRRAPKPFVAAVDGVAAAGGLGIALSCDLVFASRRASFEWAYSKTGLSGAESTTFLLPRLVGLRRSLELMLLNPRLSAADAHAAGLITSVHDVERFDDVVLDIAERLTRGPRQAFAVAKELLNQAAGMDRLDDHLDRELDELARIADGPEFAEGLEAFFHKRPPRFTTDGDPPMHEYSIVQAMFEQIEAHVHERGALAVRRVRVSVGAAAGVDIGLLATAYDTWRACTICEHAPLDIRQVPERWSCPAGHGDVTPGRPLRCEVCGRPARLTSGDEILLEQLELEVP